MAQGFSNVVFSDRTARERAVERKVLAMGCAHRQHLPLSVSVCGASSQSMQRRLRSLQHGYSKVLFSFAMLYHHRSGM